MCVCRFSRLCCYLHHGTYIRTLVHSMHVTLRVLIYITILFIHIARYKHTYVYACITLINYLHWHESPKVLLMPVYVPFSCTLPFTFADYSCMNVFTHILGWINYVDPTAFVTFIVHLLHVSLTLTCIILACLMLCMFVTFTQWRTASISFPEFMTCIWMHVYAYECMLTLFRTHMTSWYVHFTHMYIYIHIRTCSCMSVFTHILGWIYYADPKAFIT
jgi:hypothetical protein